MNQHLMDLYTYIRITLQFDAILMIFFHKFEYEIHLYLCLWENVTALVYTWIDKDLIDLIQETHVRDRTTRGTCSLIGEYKETTPLVEADYRLVAWFGCLGQQRCNTIFI